jgi:hypothetical protein
MLRVTFTGGDAPQRWLFDPDNVSFAEAEMIEGAMGGASWDDFLRGLLHNRARVRRVLLWHLQRRVHPDLQLADMPDYRMGDLKVEFGTEEIDLLIADARDVRDRDPGQIDKLIETLEFERIQAGVAEAAIEAGDVDADPKEPAPADPGTLPEVVDPVMREPETAPSENSGTRSSASSRKRTGSGRGRSTT